MNWHKKTFRSKYLKQCWRCKWWLPRWFYNKLPEGWYGRDGLSYSCKKCTLQEPTRYSKVKGKMFDSKEPYTLTLWERIKETFNCLKS